MAKFRKRSDEIEAFRLLPGFEWPGWYSRLNEGSKALTCNPGGAETGSAPLHAVLWKPEGLVVAQSGDWILLQGGALSVVPHDDFEATYQPIPEGLDGMFGFFGRPTRPAMPSPPSPAAGAGAGVRPRSSRWRSGSTRRATPRPCPRCGSGPGPPCPRRPTGGGCWAGRPTRS